MFYGKQTDEIKQLEDQYEKVIGVKVRGELGFELDESDADLYIMMLEECINSHKDIFTLIRELDKIVNEAS